MTIKESFLNIYFLLQTREGVDTTADPPTMLNMLQI